MTGLEVTLIVLGSLFGLALLTALIGLVCTPFVRGPEDPFFLGYFRVFNLVYARVVHGIRGSLREDFLPEGSPAIVVANHLSGADPLLLATVTRRRIRFLMAREYYEVFGLQWIFRSLGAIPVNRDGNELSATREALKALKDGGVIGIFPEGGIQEEASSLEAAKSGVALLALRTGASIYPVYIDGPGRFESVVAGVLLPTRTKLIRGTPIDVMKPDGRASREQLEQLTERVMDSLRELRSRSTCNVKEPRTSEGSVSTRT